MCRTEAEVVVRVKILRAVKDKSVYFLWSSHSFVVFAENWVILGVFYYPALYYPLLACGTLHNKVGYVLGSLLSWTHFGVLVWQKIDCPKSPLVSKDDIQYRREFQCIYETAIDLRGIECLHCHWINCHFQCVICLSFKD